MHSYSDPRGIIPMRVGTSQKLEMEYKGYRDHPHACGDKLTRSTADTKP